ncbi:MAG: family 43 glycosylhydrolase [Phycisphaerae bacterium]|jgi:hypothetical protein
MKRFILAALIAATLCEAATAQTVAYWRFEEGPYATAITQPFGARDSSGNGNHLSPLTEGGTNGYLYRRGVPFISVPGTGIANNLCIQNTGSYPSLSTRSTNRSYGTGSYPAGTDIETITPAQFTVEAFFKPENGGWRTIVGRDAVNIANGSSALAALYFQIRTDYGVKAGFTDVSGYWHTAESSEHVIKGFDLSTDSRGREGKWYYMAAVSDGSTLSLYLANVSDNGPLWLLAQTDLTASGSPNTALAAGTEDGTDWHSGAWTIGRGLYNGNHADIAKGYIDEVRISDTALSPRQFLRPGELEQAAAANNPILTGADPDVLIVDDRVWVYPTSGAREKFYTYSSKDLVSWQAHSSILNIDNIPWMPSGKWGWAPGIIERDGTYYFYFCAGLKPGYIGVATASAPYGPFTDSGEVLLADYGDPGFEAIDPMAYKDPISGKYYFYAGGSAGSTLRVFELNDDMVSFKSEIDVDTPHLFTEGSFMHYHEGTYYLSYSHGYYSMPNYSVHYSTSLSPLGPWTYQGPLIVSDYRHKSPGHHSFLYNAAMDEWYIFYHRYNYRSGPGPYSGSRELAIEKMQYNEDGTIVPFEMTDGGVGPVRLGNIHRADFTGNGRVGLWDLYYLIDVWLTNDVAGDITPVGGDNIVDKADFSVMAGQWLKSPQVH